MNKRNLQRCARAIQAECGTSYTRAYQWTRENADEIISMIRTDDGYNWEELKAAAAGLYRRNHAH